jgi:hypothetical protein
MKTKYKIIGVLLTVIAASIHLLNTGYRDWNAGGDSAYVGAMFLFFVLKEEIDDERVKDLKLKALQVGFAIGWCMTFVSKLALRFVGRVEQPRAISAYDFMFVTLLSAFAMFQYWRWRDGRMEDANGLV